ncbi:hypothetical protein AIP04_25280, partial [Salmonella enterica]|nr:hypothetical protein [Salmonella enterica]
MYRHGHSSSRHESFRC